MDHIGGKTDDLPEPSNFHVKMTFVLFAMFCPKHDQPAIIEGDYLVTELMMAHVSVEETGKEESGRIGLLKLTKKEPKRMYSDIMVFSCLSLTLANHLKPIYVTVHLEEVSFKRVLIDGGAAVNVLPYKQMKNMCKSEEDLIPTDLTVSSFSGTITKTHGILHLEVDLGSKKIMLAFFVMDNTSTYGALLGRDWIHQSLFVPFTLHQKVAVYHEEEAMGPGFWEIVEVKSRPFLPTANVAEASFYNPSIGILQCLGANKNDRRTKVKASYCPNSPTPVVSEQRIKDQVVAVRSLIKRPLVYGRERKQELRQVKMKKKYISFHVKRITRDHSLTTLHPWPGQLF
ncbi:hypothetical protein ACFX13_029955 [Malus domestica]